MAPAVMWPLRYRPTRSFELASPFGYFSQAELSSSRGDSMAAQQTTCQWPLRQSVRDFPLHFDPHSIPM